jgi:hypothetical protein
LGFAGDFNGDGRLDLVTANNSRRLTRGVKTWLLRRA